MILSLSSLKSKIILVPDYADSGSDSLSGSESNAAKALDSNVAPKVLKTQNLSFFRTKLWGVFYFFLFARDLFS